MKIWKFKTQRTKLVEESKRVRDGKDRKREERLDLDLDFDRPEDFYSHRVPHCMPGNAIDTFLPCRTYLFPAGVCQIPSLPNGRQLQLFPCQDGGGVEVSGGRN